MPEVADAVASRAVSVAADPAIAGAITTRGPPPARHSTRATPAPPTGPSMCTTSTQIPRVRTTRPRFSQPSRTAKCSSPWLLPHRCPFCPRPRQFLDRGRGTTLTAGAASDEASPRLIFVEVTDAPGVIGCSAENSQEHRWYLLGGDGQAAQLVAPLARGDKGIGMSLREQGLRHPSWPHHQKRRRARGHRAHPDADVGADRGAAVPGGHARDNLGDREILVAGKRLSFKNCVIETNLAHGFRADTAGVLVITGGIYRVRRSGSPSAIRLRGCTDTAITGALISGGDGVAVGNGMYVDTHAGLATMGKTFRNFATGIPSYVNAVSGTQVGPNTYVNGANPFVDNATNGTVRYPALASSVTTGERLRDTLLAYGLLT